MGTDLLLRLSKTLANDFQTLTDLSVFNGERYKDAQHVVIRAAGEKNQTFIAGARHDLDRKSTRLNSSHLSQSRMPSSA